MPLGKEGEPEDGEDSGAAVKGTCRQSWWQEDGQGGACQRRPEIRGRKACKGFGGGRILTGKGASFGLRALFPQGSCLFEINSFLLPPPHPPKRKEKGKVCNKPPQQESNKRRDEGCLCTCGGCYLQDPGHFMKTGGCVGVLLRSLTEGPRS